ncbi:hypothetical protein ACIBSV_30890 [Embleya sp. NPDC050154]|uniref:hypothetical protein n=1 Tax=Embleya sp. NPDC050154 TaxID=3363988 RepID=UPI0037B95758
MGSIAGTYPEREHTHVRAYVRLGSRAWSPGRTGMYGRGMLPRRARAWALSGSERSTHA